MVRYNKQATIKYHIPHIETELAGARKVIESNKKTSPGQEPLAGFVSVPQITSDNSVFVFAGNTGLAASRLDFKSMFFTDADSAKVRAAYQSGLGKRPGVSFAVRNIFTVEETGFDWVFSFKPHFIQESNLIVPKLLSIPRKGVVLVHEGALAYLGESMREAYGAVVESVPSKAVKGEGGKEEKIPAYIVARTTPEINKMALTDLKVTKALNKSLRRDMPALAKVRQRLVMDFADFKASILRLDRCCRSGPVIKKWHSLQVEYGA